MTRDEMQALIEAQGVKLAALDKSMGDVMINVLPLVAKLEERCAALEAKIVELTENQQGDHDTLFGVFGQMEELAEKVGARNKSAALKRNMTDADALRVMTGDLKDQPHLEAANMIGLTYAQVYSCRLGYTFKTVHHDLMKGGWKNPWDKKAVRKA